MTTNTIKIGQICSEIIRWRGANKLYTEKYKEKLLN